MIDPLNLVEKNDYFPFLHHVSGPGAPFPSPPAHSVQLMFLLVFVGQDAMSAIFLLVLVGQAVLNAIFLLVFVRQDAQSVPQFVLDHCPSFFH